MKNLKVDDRVRIVEREQTAADEKEQSYFPHFAGLTGVVSKLYPPDEACVEIDKESLPESNAERHQDIQKQLRTRWLEGLSSDARGKLSEKELSFTLNYSVVVGVKDLEPAGAPPKKAVPEKRLSQSDLDRTEEEFLRRKAEGT